MAHVAAVAVIFLNGMWGKKALSEVVDRPV
jgi:hypothetical protein